MLFPDLFSPVLLISMGFLWADINHRSPPVSNSEPLSAIILIPGSMRGELSAQHCQQSSIMSETGGQGPGTDINNINPHPPSRSSHIPQRSDGRQERTPLCATYPYHRGLMGGLPYRYPIFLHYSLRERKDSAQRTITSLTP